MVAPKQWLASVHIAGLGPHKDATIQLDPSGYTEIEGPSQSGKTSLIRAICFCFWGCSPSGGAFKATSINDDCDEVVVKITTTGGAVYERRRTRAGTVSRFIQPPDDARLAYKREEDFARVLKAVSRTVRAGVDLHLARLILVPFEWRSLAGRPGKGRHLRDLLAAVLVKPAGLRLRVAESMHPALMLDEDPTDETAAGLLLREAKKEADELKGKATGLLEALGRIKPAVEPPNAEDVQAAKLTVQASKDWTAWDSKRADHLGGQAAADRWQTRRDAIEDVPGYDPSKRNAAADDVVVADRYLKGREHARRQISDSSAREMMAQAGVELKRAHAVYAAALDAGNKCPTCAKAWGEAKKRLALLKTDVGDCQEVYDASEAKLKAKIELIREADKEVTDAGHKADRKRDTLDTFDAGRSRLRQLAALGDRPAVPDTPTEPEGERPTQDALDEARAMGKRAGTTSALAEQLESQRSSAKKAVEWANERRDEATANVTRLDALLDAVRKAPSLALVDSLACLNVDGLEVKLVGDGVEVLVDGRGWDDGPSRGRQVAADAAFRGALRERVKLGWFPMAVDNAQGWSGELPEAVKGGPVIVLRTSPPVGGGAS